MKLRPLRVVLAATAAVGVGASGLAACFDWSTPAVSVDGGNPDTSTSDTGVLPDTGLDASADALPSCGPPITPPGLPLLHLTLDDLASLATPDAAFGPGYSTTATETNFVPGVCRNALGFEAGIHLTYPEVPKPEGGEAGAPNINYAQGTIMLWYRPDYPGADINDHALVRSTAVGNRGGVRLSRASFGGVQFNTWDSAGTLDGQLESATRLVEGRWVHIAVSWKTGEAPRLFLNGVLDTIVNPRVIDGSPPKASAAQDIGIGNNAGVGADSPADGLIDDLWIYPVALPP